ncbi:MAG: hypothetical protein CMJ84_02250 [Planctomycetes bacterium]|jgi:hypothetical protein|nr:hypothetical protein [Planctomycetota bacterium]MDP6408441.1 hypothetical protein [Planctomycetota bacterium]
MRLLAATALLLGALAGTPAAAQSTVATHYFYWYRWPDEHFQAGHPGREGHRRHFPQPERVSYLDARWHRAQFRAMAACGIDVALPVYWGAPGAYERPSLRFSRAGLQPMVEALDSLAAADLKGVRLGLFYDTSTLLCDVRGVPPRGGRADLRTAKGKRLFCRTVTDYFDALPRRLWARLGGRALVVLYSSDFAAGWDATLGPALREAFVTRFDPEGVFLVADASWGDIGQDRTTSWGAALAGPRLFDGVAQIGPGYDDSPVPGRRTPIREREGGAFYGRSWRRAVLSEPELVLIETWNEMHEGTEICETRELGTTYADLTREWIRRLRSGDAGPPIELRFPAPRPRPDHTWGTEAAGVEELSCVFDGDPARRLGLRELAWEDGPLRLADGRLHSEGGTAPRYVYFQVSDHWAFDTERDLELLVDCDPGPARLRLEYDSHDGGATLSGSYTTVEAGAREGARGGVLFVFALPRARLANRQNGGADLRLCPPGSALAIRGVRLRRRPAD